MTEASITRLREAVELFRGGPNWDLWQHVEEALAEVRRLREESDSWRVACVLWSDWAGEWLRELGLQPEGGEWGNGPAMDALRGHVQALTAERDRLQVALFDEMALRAELAQERARASGLEDLRSRYPHIWETPEAARIEAALALEAAVLAFYGRHDDYLAGTCSMDDVAALWGPFQSAIARCRAARGSGGGR